MPDEIVRRFCVLGTPQEHVDKLAELAGLGMTQFRALPQHDGQGRDPARLRQPRDPGPSLAARTKTD